MARFYVGQRVRLARPLEIKDMGNVGTIVCFRKRPAGTIAVDGSIFKIDTDCGVLWDHESDGVTNAQHTDQLEPLADLGREVVSWDACAWKPEHLRDKVS